LYDVGSADIAESGLRRGNRNPGGPGRVCPVDGGSKSQDEEKEDAQVTRSAVWNDGRRTVAEGRRLRGRG